MGATGVRTWLLVGGGLGVVAALFVILLNGTLPAVLLESALALGAGLLTAYLMSQAPVPAPAGAPAPSTRGNLTRAGALSGATVGVLAGIGLLVIALQVVYTPQLQDAITRSFEQQGIQAGSIQGLLGVAAACLGCFYIVLVPAIMAGFGALGAWIMGRTRPATAAPPPAPSSSTYTLPPLPPTPAEDSPETRRMPPVEPGGPGAGAG